MELPDYYKRLAITIKNEIKAGERADHTHCRHGNFVGDPYGPDYMCGPCELGVNDYDYAFERAEKVWRNDRRKIGYAIRQALIEATDDDTPSAAQVLALDEFSSLLFGSLFLTGDLRRELDTIHKAMNPEKWTP